MCQEALADLKMAIRAAGEHKQRITIHVAIDGLRLRDEKTGDSLYHHPVHKISFIAQDMSDSRAFGYIFGSPDTGHRFFGIKTDKAASQVVIAMRDLFQVVFELKKKEIELAKQHLEQKSYVSNSKIGYLGDSHLTSKMNSISESSVSGKLSSTSDSSKGASGGPAPEAIADLVDLELELSSIQQGIHQMERITPSDPFGPNKEDPFVSDPFGDSFTSFPKPFLPPPPSAKERSNRVASESGSIFSPRPGLLSASSDTSRQDSSMFDSPTDNSEWFSAGSFTNDDCGPASATSTTNESATEQASKHEETKNQILAQFDVFTELDPLGTGKIKPYVDKKLFFQELKNPPKKVLKDLVPTSSVLPATTVSTASATTTTETAKPFKANFDKKTDSFQMDPFADDPFDKVDPFAEEEFRPQPQDPFNTDFVVDFKMYNKQELKPIQNTSLASKTDTTKELIDSLKFPPIENILDDNTTSENNFSKSPSQSKTVSSIEKHITSIEKQFSLQNSASPSKSLFSKQNTFDCKFEFPDKRKELSLLHENPSLDLSSESESTAPEPPPRPSSNITPTIKPPPLPPKKQQTDMLMKPPPRPPHTDLDSHYDYIDGEMNSLDSLDKSPPLPVPSRKSQKSEWEIGMAPQRPKKTLSVTSSQEDYLTPVAPPPLPPQKKDTTRKDAPILLPPPQKREVSKKKSPVNYASPTIKPPKPEPQPQPVEDISDITLTDLTTSGLDKLAAKLNVPANKLSSMTLVELTAFLQEYISNRNKYYDQKSGQQTDSTFPTFKAEFSMNFSDFNDSTKVTATNTENFDRYAVFRELLEKDEAEKSAKIPTVSTPEISTTIPEVITENIQNIKLNDEIPVKDTNTTPSADRYAALREIIVEDLETNVEEKELNIDVNEDEIKNKEDKIVEHQNEQNDLSQVTNKEEEDVDLFHSIDNSIFNSEKIKESNIIEYRKSIELEMNEIPTKDIDNEITVAKSPSNKSPIPITEIVTQSTNHLTSGSLSDVISNSSPEMDNRSPDVKKKETTAESWAIFDTPKIQKPMPKEKHNQSEEGISPWSSDSKEFTNTSPTVDWRNRKDSGGSGSDKQWPKQPRNKPDADNRGWWDSELKLRGKYDSHQLSREEKERHRRSTDSYDDEYEMERSYHGGRDRRIKQTSSSWNRGHQSSSSRDVSPWEEEPCRDWNRRRGPPHSRKSRDSWDEEDDYEYEADHPEVRWSNRRSGSRERHSRRTGPVEDVWSMEDRRHGPRRRHRPLPDSEHHCCGDWEQDSDAGYIEEPRYSNRYSQEMWRERDRKKICDEDKYYSRNHPGQESWDDEYPVDEEPHGSRYLTAKRNWKRPSSASEMDRKSGENKSKQNPYHMVMASSDGERERRYKTTGRRARSRDSEITYNRHKLDPGLTLRHRSRDRHPKSPFEDDFSEQSLDTPSPKTKYGFNITKTNKKSLTSPKSDMESPQSNLPKQRHSQNSDFEATTPVGNFKFDDFVSGNAEKFESDNFDKDGPPKSTKATFETDFFDKGYRKPPNTREQLFFDNEYQPEKDYRPSRTKINFRQESQFEDDFSPTDKPSDRDSENVRIAEETVERVDAFTSKNNLDKSVNFNESRKQKSSLGKRLSGTMRQDLNLKKSESINIFARESDPFDDDFFSKPENGAVVITRDHKNTINESVQWSEDFDCFEVIDEDQ
ncbi:protein disabled isoform X2 [Chrysoperla carnea]|nr:protein disabled isoform X2 [Chrysoperla carnea]